MDSFVVAHEVNQLGIFLAGNAVGPVVLQHIVGYAVQYSGGKAQLHVRQYHTDYKAPGHGIAVRYRRLVICRQATLWRGLQCGPG